MRSRRWSLLCCLVAGAIASLSGGPIPATRNASAFTPAECRKTCKAQVDRSKAYCLDTEKNSRSCCNCRAKGDLSNCEAQCDGQRQTIFVCDKECTK